MTVMDNEDPADPSAHEPRVTGSPETVWLVYGDLERDVTHRECCESGEVTWCEDAQFPADVRYLRADLLYQQAREIAAQALNTRERELLQGLIERELWHAKTCDAILARPDGNHRMASAQKGWDMERVALLRKLGGLGA